MKYKINAVVIGKQMVFYGIMVLFAVLLFCGCGETKEKDYVKSSEPVIIGYFSCLEEAGRVENAIRNAACDLKAGQPGSKDNGIPELEGKIFNLVNAYQKNNPQSSSKLREVHTTLLYPSLTDREQQMLQKAGYGAIMDNGGVGAFDPPILWVKTSGMAPRMEEFTAFGTMAFEVCSEQEEQNLAVSFEVSYEPQKNIWKVTDFKHKVW